MAKITRTLALTTPHMKGADVKALQKALDTSKYGDFLEGSKLDGDFGQYTAAAVRRAKQALGYEVVNEQCGQQLVDFLTGKKPLTPVMAKRRKARLAKAAAKPLPEKAVAEARKLVGIKESPPFSNRCAVSIWYGIIGAWCAMTVTLAYVRAGSKAFVKGSFSASCEQILNAAMAGQRGLSIVRTPRLGDLAFLKWPGLSRWKADHVGIVVKLKPLTLIEGNTTPDGQTGSQANGGMCCVKNREDERRQGIVKYYVRVSQ